LGSPLRLRVIKGGEKNLFGEFPKQSEGVGNTNPFSNSSERKGDQRAKRCPMLPPRGGGKNPPGGEHTGLHNRGPHHTHRGGAQNTVHGATTKRGDTHPHSPG